MLFPTYSEWSNLGTNGSFEEIPPQLSAAATDSQPAPAITDRRLYGRLFTQQNIQVAVSPAHQIHSRLPMDITVTPKSPISFTRSRIGTDAAFGSLSDISRADSDVDIDDFGNFPEFQRFYCTDYPPCSLSFVRSEYLAKHTRKHIGERPFQCGCGRKFSRLDSVRQHAQTAHSLDPIMTDSMTGLEARSQHQAWNPSTLSTRRRTVHPIASKEPSSDSRRNSTTNISETWGSSPGKATSRSGSVSCIQSDRGRTSFKGLFSRRSSAHSQSGSGYEEIVFDSRSAHSGSQASGASGRRGPLDIFARSAMNAVKRVGACWRCKFLRKSCNADSPCDLCPKRNPWSKSNWEVVGCKRGELKTHMASIRLCAHPGIVQPELWEEIDIFGGSNFFEDANNIFQRNIGRRERKLSSLAMDAFLRPDNESLGIAFDPYESSTPFLPPGLPALLYVSLQSPTASPPALVPLNECILAMAWEFHDNPSLMTILNNEPEEVFVNLLRSSAIYQANLESDQLIAQSLICLRSCLEAIRVKELGYLERSSHVACGKETCKVQCIASLDLSLTLYLDELSRVFFKKESQKNKAGWYISAFYSFCIQAIVRRALKCLSSDAVGLTDVRRPRFRSFWHSALMASNQYLHLAIHLFIASSGTYQPLKTDYSSITTQPLCLYEEDLLSLQKAIGLPTVNCGEYLKKIFEIEEATLEAPPNSPRYTNPGIPTDYKGDPRTPHSKNLFGALPGLNARDQANKSMAGNVQRLEKLVAMVTSENLDPDMRMFLHGP